LDQYIEILTDRGRLRGRTDNDLTIYRGVRFALSPTGVGRFCGPRPLTPWEGVRDALEDGPICPQSPSRLSQLMGQIAAEQGEDCLSLTIWAPRKSDGPRPIVIWFHGGGYSSGAGSLGWYDGGKLARDTQAIIVGVNYRLGALGYLYHPQLSAGNCGLLDQIAAIKWVVRNAAILGGDASRITLMGQSAGAHSIACLMTMPATRGLVRRAIMLSTPFGMRTIAAEQAAATADALLGQLGINVNRADALERLQALPVDEILKAQMAVAKVGAGLGNPTPAFGPVGVGDLPDASRFLSALHDAAADTEVLIGTTREELSAFYRFDPRLQTLGRVDFLALVNHLFGEKGSMLLTAVRRYRPGGTDVEALIDLQTESYFVRDTFALAAASRRGWVYQFDWQAPRLGLMACHCVDLPFVFGTLDVYGDVPMLGANDCKKEALSAIIRAAIGAFVTSGDPNNESLPHWPPFVPQESLILRFDNVITLTSVLSNAVTG
jgi:para-nitrobenzyl esterase